MPFQAPQGQYRPSFQGQIRQSLGVNPNIFQWLASKARPFSHPNPLGPHPLQGCLTTSPYSHGVVFNPGQSSCVIYQSVTAPVATIGDQMTKQHYHVRGSDTRTLQKMPWSLLGEKIDSDEYYTSSRSDFPKEVTSY